MSKISDERKEDFGELEEPVYCKY